MKVYYRHISLGLLVLFFIMLSFSKANAYDVEFEWLANPEPLTGYNLYYTEGADSEPPFTGVGIAEGDAPISIPKVITTGVTGLDPTKTYKFALTAYVDGDCGDYTAIKYHEDGKPYCESGYSDIVTIPALNTPTIKKLYISI